MHTENYHSVIFIPKFHSYDLLPNKIVLRYIVNWDSTKIPPFTLICWLHVPMSYFKWLFLFIILYDFYSTPGRCSFNANYYAHTEHSTWNTDDNYKGENCHAKRDTKINRNVFFFSLSFQNCYLFVPSYECHSFMVDILLSTKACVLSKFRMYVDTQ